MVACLWSWGPGRGFFLSKAPSAYPGIRPRQCPTIMKRLPAGTRVSWRMGTGSWRSGGAAREHRQPPAWFPGVCPCLRVPQSTWAWLGQWEAPEGGWGPGLTAGAALLPGADLSLQGSEVLSDQGLAPPQLCAS